MGHRPVGCAEEAGGSGAKRKRNEERKRNMSVRGGKALVVCEQDTFSVHRGFKSRSTPMCMFVSRAGIG